MRRQSSAERGTNTLNAQKYNLSCTYLQIQCVKFIVDTVPTAEEVLYSIESGCNVVTDVKQGRNLKVTVDPKILTLKVLAVHLDTTCWPIKSTFVFVAYIAYCICSSKNFDDNKVELIFRFETSMHEFTSYQHMKMHGQLFF